MTNFNQTPYLPSQLDFPSEQPKQLGIVLDKMYIDIASRINDRTIGIFSVNTPITLGDVYYFAGVQTRQQSQRLMYNVTSTANFNHGIKNLNRRVHFYGDWTDGTGNWYGFISGTPNAIAGQIVISLSTTQIIFTVGAGAPALTLGQIVIEWI